MANANEVLENDKKALQMLLEAKNKSEKQSYAEASKPGTSKGTSSYNPDDWIPKYKPKSQTKSKTINIDSDSSDSESEVEWTDVESKRSKRKKKMEKEKDQKDKEHNKKEETITCGINCETNKYNERKNSRNQSTNGSKKEGTNESRNQRTGESRHQRTNDSRNDEGKRYCHFYNNGRRGCDRGNDCRYLHEEAPRCKFDDRCRSMAQYGRCNFYHDGQSFLGTGFQSWRSPWGSRSSPQSRRGRWEEPPMSRMGRY